MTEQPCDQQVRPTLSVVVIVKNEERDLQGFLRSFAPIADEIVMIDDGSTDSTAEIAEASGEQVKFVRAPRADNEGFCDQRNKGVAAAKSEWLLQVDCDMRLTPEIAQEIVEAICEPGRVAYRFRLKQHFLNHPVRYGGFQYWNQAWLVRRRAIRWTQKLHERANIDATPEQIGQLRNRMIHLNDHDFSERLHKNYQYSQLEAERLLTAKGRVTIFELVTMPLWRAFRSYILMRGFLDGRIGFIWGLYQFTGSMTAYFLAWDAANRRPREETAISPATVSSSRRAT